MAIRIPGSVDVTFARIRSSNQFIILTTKSGRIFRFEISEYPVNADSTLDEIGSLALRVVDAKYRYSPWDRKHPDVNVKEEIYEEVCAYFRDQIHSLQRARLENGDKADELVCVERITYSRRHRQPKRQTMMVVWEVCNPRGDLVKRFPYNQKLDAEEFKSKVDREGNGSHFIRQLKVPMDDSDIE
jgi:hypothetical protein